VRTTGRLIKWDDTRGFGFIQAAGGGPDIFVHFSKFRDRRRRPQIGARLSFEVARDLQNRLSAADVRYGDEVVRRTPERSRAAEGSVWPATAVALLTLAAVTTATVLGRLPWFVPVICVVASLVVHLLGGWPGGLIASRLFHHKSKKAGFRVAFHVCVVINCAVLAWLAFFAPF
jgi:cold shock CspA family protein